MQTKNVNNMSLKNAYDEKVNIMESIINALYKQKRRCQFIKTNFANKKLYKKG